MVYNLVIDADSILYTACYNSQLVNKKSIDVEYPEEERKESFNIERAYLNFCSTISRIESMVFSKHREEYIKGQWRGKDIIDGLVINTEIIFSPKHTFRNELSDIYKSNRKPSDIFGISDLKNLVFERLNATQVELVEADDIVITRAYELENVYIACIDKDIYTHSPVPCILYNEWEWTDAVDKETIEEEYYYQAIMGDSTDGIKGVTGIGKVGARALVSNALEPMTYEKYVSLFDTEEDAILSMRLVRMDQFKNGKLVLWDGM